jgi:hypothetical protein
MYKDVMVRKERPAFVPVIAKLHRDCGDPENTWMAASSFGLLAMTLFFTASIKNKRK